ncbi:VOC family protein [Chloroflexi bacterium TSY]|nr:VOC family protein [Chloroflexi bacterium TSY]
MNHPQEVTKYPQGTFSWVDLQTTDTDAAKSFYTGLFGWTYEDNPVGEGVYYTMFSLNGKNVAALSRLQQEMQDQGVPPFWTSYITTYELDAIPAKVETAGGTMMMQPFDVMTAGRMALLQDPAGAAVAVWEPKEHIGAELVNIPGTLVWNELATRDTEAAAKFYTSVFDWTTTVSDNPEAPYTMFVNGERMAGGMLEMEEQTEGVPPHWGVYFAVENCDESTAKAKELGGQALVGPFDIPNTGRMTVIQDPQGGVFMIMQMENVDPAPQG